MIIVAGRMASRAAFGGSHAGFAVALLLLLSQVRPCVAVVGRQCAPSPVWPGRLTWACHHNAAPGVQAAGAQEVDAGTEAAAP